MDGGLAPNLIMITNKKRDPLQMASFHLLWLDNMLMGFVNELFKERRT